MVKSYKELLHNLKREFELKKDDLRKDLPRIFPILKKEMTRSNYTMTELEDFLREMSLKNKQVKLDNIEKRIFKFYRGKLEGIVQEDWLLSSLKTWLKSEMKHKKPPFRDLRLLSKINFRYPGEKEGIEIDILGVGLLERRKNQSKYEFWAIEAKVDNKSFYRKIRQIFGYPSFIDKLFFAAYFQGNTNYSPEQRAFARRTGVNLLRLTSSGNPTPKTRFNVQKVSLRGGKDETYIRERFGKKIWELNQNGSTTIHV
ncbi:hypothetical protein CEE45_01650 [Candidatus Heimdallarchaeota archaeon B3_Heim]|nr:MAG: hypothetical protein CEE45_01650 [Candidatus Heimdallarchaeota archaeon B3_Heim]